MLIFIKNEVKNCLELVYQKDNREDFLVYESIEAKIIFNFIFTI